MELFQLLKNRNNYENYNEPVFNEVIQNISQRLVKILKNQDELKEQRKQNQKEKSKYQSINSDYMQ